MKKLDLREHQCPYPVVQTRKEMLENPGMPFSVLVGDETARDNVTRLAESMGYVIQTDTLTGGFALGLTPESAPETGTGSQPASGPTITLITSDVMGRGDDELGQLLMKNYLFTLAEMDQVPDKMLLVNSAVKLACEVSDTLEALEQIACMGVDIASCGLCLDFYNLKEKLQVGRTTNMLEVAESLQTAGRIIRM
jgi:selenium metabolism protein YedF